MKKSRLLEIIREEISAALNETATIDVPGDGKKMTPQQKQQKINTARSTSGDRTLGTDKNPVEFVEEGEKVKKLAEKYQLDEETINEMASVAQTKNALTRLGDKTGYDLVKDVEQETLDQFKKDPLIKSGRLARNLNPDEYPNKKERTIGFGAEFSKNFKKKTGISIEDFNEDIVSKWEKKFPGTVPFKSTDFATNTSEKEAAVQVFNLEKGKQGRKADPNKEEKPASTGKKGRPAGEPKAKVATRTPGDDGFDKVEYSDVDGEDKEATQNVGSDSTAKELGKKADVSKNPDFDRIRKGLQNKRKNSKDGILSPEDMKLAINIINTAKDKYKFNTTQVDSLRADIGL